MAENLAPENPVIIYSNSAMIRMSDMKYPVYIRDFREEYRNVSIGDWVFEEAMKDFEYYLVRDGEIPVNDVVTEGYPTFDEEKQQWFKKWFARPFTPEEVAANLAAAKQLLAVNSYYIFSEDLASGVPVEGELYNVEPREIASLQTVLNSLPTSGTVLVKTLNFQIKELPVAEAKVLIEKIFAARYKLQQSHLKYLQEVDSTALKENLPENPLTFKE